MAFFQLILSARRLEKARAAYHDEKLKSMEISKGGKVHYTLAQRIRIKKIMFKMKMREFWSKCLSLPEDTWLHERIELLKTDGSLENFILKSIVGFLGGIFLTYMFFMFFVFQLNFTLSSATLLCSIFGIILTIGLAFSHRVRCVVFLLLPQFFSKRGRQALMAYAFILALTGPAKNTLHNIGVLSESLACGQEQLKEAVKTIIDLVKQPFYALRDAIARVIKTVKIVVRKIKEALLAIKRMVLSILRVIKSVFEWLGSIVNICNKKLGTPFERCQKVFDGAVGDCYAKLGPFFGGICNLAYVVGALCYIVKPLDFICILVSFLSDAIVGAVRKKIKKFAKHMKAMFYVKVNFSHSFHFETNQSRTLEDVATGIVTEIRSRTDKFLVLFDWMSFATSFFVLFMLLRIIHYRHKWLTNERFDNRYITQDLRQIDLIRARQDKETVLPLNPRERSKYIPLTSITLIAMEKIHLAKSAVFLALTTFKLCIHMMIDYSLYWILSRIRYHGRFETKVQQVNSVGIFVSGDGYLAQLYRSIIKAFSPADANIEIDTLPCLPDPIPPDFDRYTQIVSLILICWVMAVFEPYGLRLRQVVMTYYHPERAKQRAVWLYNHIIRSRGSFIKFARRQLRRKFGMNGDKTIENVTFKERVLAMCPILQRCFPQKQEMCLLCGAPQRDDQLPHIKCSTPGCVGIFCPQCFADLQNLCTICRSPMEYGDMSDMSEERDSSEDDLPIRPIKKVGAEKSTKEEFEEITEETTEVETTPDVEKEGEKSDLLNEDILSESSSLYSQSYQDESPVGMIPRERRLPTTRDVEAQRLRDDVTIQIFNEPLLDSGESSASPTCFVLRAHRKLRSRVQPTCPCKSDSSSLTSSGDSDSCCSDSTEEIEEEEVLHIEVEDSERKALLGAGGSKMLQRKRGRVQRIVDALTRVSFIRNRRGRTAGRRPHSRRDSITQRVVRMLQSRSPACIPCGGAKAKTRSDGEQPPSDFYDDSNKRRKNRGKRSKSHPQGTERYCCRDIYSMNWDSHRERGGADRRRSQLIDSMASRTKYYEVDETVSSTDQEQRQKQKPTGSKKSEKKLVITPTTDIYDPLAGLEIYDVKSKTAKTAKKLRAPEEEEEADKQINQELTPVEDTEEKKVEEETGLASDSTSEFATDTDGEKEGRKPGTGLYSEYCRRFKKRKRKCKKCKKKRDKGEQTEQKVETPAVEATQSPRYNFRPIIYPVPACFRRAPLCPGMGYDVEEWLSLQDQKSHAVSKRQEAREKLEGTPFESTSTNESCEAPTIPPPCSTYGNYTIPALRRFLPMYQGSGLIQELKEQDRRKTLMRRARPKFVACRGIQNDLGSLPRVSGARETSFPKGGPELPYQSTEGFQQLVDEYRKVARPEVESWEIEPAAPDEREEESRLIADSKELVQIYPKRNSRPSAISKLKSRLMSTMQASTSHERTQTRWSDTSSSPIETHGETSEMESTDDKDTTL